MKMEPCENIYQNSSKINRPNSSAFTSTCVDTYNQEDNGRIPQTASQQSDRSKVYKGAIVLLCAILLSCVIGLSVNRAETNKLQIDYHRCIDDKANFSRQYKNLTTERDHLEKSKKAQIKKNQWLEKLVLNVGCTTGWRNFSNHLYCASTKELTWNESRDNCMEKRAYLVIINNIEEQEYVANLKINAWIGLTDSQTEGVWKWVDNTEPIHKYWMAGEPNNIDGKENCVEILSSISSQQNWNDVACDIRKYYICEYEY
nr:C-type lectin domain family 4 member E-like [Misgurnus anguillicaudatus]